MSDEILVVGAGLSGAVVGRTLAEADIPVTIIDSRSHTAGNCHTQRDPQTGVMVHTYGPHIFHTDDAEVWEYVNRYDRFEHYRSRVKTEVRGRVYSLPVNLHTINQFFGRTFRPDEARQFLAAQAQSSPGQPPSFETEALRTVGRELYETFFRGYTEKQWGLDPRELPASVFRRLPLRFDYNDNYYRHRFQGLPRHGYSALVDNILDHDRISVNLGETFRRGQRREHVHVFYSGPVDGYFDHQFGRLGYRTLDFERFVHRGDYQGCAIMNFGDSTVAHTRITEHNHFSSWESHDDSLCLRESPRACDPDDIPYYPIRLAREQQLLTDYAALVANESNVTFMGRLGTYRYLDMDVTIREALDTARRFLEKYQRARR